MSNVVLNAWPLERIRRRLAELQGELRTTMRDKQALVSGRDLTIDEVMALGPVREIGLLAEHLKKVERDILSNQEMTKCAAWHAERAMALADCATDKIDEQTGATLEQRCDRYQAALDAYALRAGELNDDEKRVVADIKLAMAVAGCPVG